MWLNPITMVAIASPNKATPTTTTHVSHSLGSQYPLSAPDFAAGTGSRRMRDARSSTVGLSGFRCLLTPALLRAPAYRSVSAFADLSRDGAVGATPVTSRPSRRIIARANREAAHVR